MVDFEIIRGSAIVMAVIMVSFVVLNTFGPLVDEIDYSIYHTDMSSYPKAESTLHMFHDSFFYSIIVINLITIAWFVYSIYQKISYSKVGQTW